MIRGRCRHNSLLIAHLFPYPCRRGSHYVDYNFYVAYNENGENGHVVGDPEIEAQLDKLNRCGSQPEPARET